MGVNDDFWDDLLGHIRKRILVPVVGPYLTVAKVDDTEQTLTTLIGQRLAAKYALKASPGIVTMDKAVEGVLRKRGRDEVERLYRVINDIIDEYPAPGDPLRNLAAIADLPLFVSTTPDRLLAQAVNEVRVEGGRATRELTFSPTQSTSKQVPVRNAQPPAETDTVVLRLFGQAASTPEYAIHDEDRLEWLHALLSDPASLPEWLGSQLKEQPMLFVGCGEIPDWIGRFLLRMSSNTRLLFERKQFFFVGSPTSQARSLSNFFATYCRKSQVQQLKMAPTDFVAELHARWEEQTPPQEDGDGHPRPPPPPPSDAPTIFISYMREDIDAARNLSNAISGLGGDVWLDERRILPGDAWKRETLTAIRRTIRLFIAVISANTEGEEQGYVFEEWRAAAKRSLSIAPRRRFIVPVIIDENYDPSRYREILDEFEDLDFGHAPAGDPDERLVTMLIKEIQNMRRSGAA
jgi:hypothetical protein